MSPLLHPFAEQVRGIVRDYLSGTHNLDKSAALLAALWDKASRDYQDDSEVSRSFAVMGFVGFVTFPVFMGPSGLDSLEDAKRVAPLIDESYERFLDIERGRLTSA
jgi:hypothetical protein